MDDLWSWILQESSPVFDRFSSLIFQTTGEDENGWVSLARHRELLAPATAYLSFPASEFNLKEYTHLVVGDLTTRPGLTQALEAVLRLAEEGNVRVFVVCGVLVVLTGIRRAGKGAGGIPPQHGAGFAAGAPGAQGERVPRCSRPASRPHFGFGPPRLSPLSLRLCSLH